MHNDFEEAAVSSPLILLIGAAFAVLGFREATRHVEKYGRGPWGLAPAAWAAICFVSGLIGGLLLYVARKSESRPDLRPELGHGFGSAKEPTKPPSSDAPVPSRHFTL